MDGMEDVGGHLVDDIVQIQAKKNHDQVGQTEMDLSGGKEWTWLHGQTETERTQVESFGPIGYIRLSEETTEELTESRDHEECSKAERQTAIVSRRWYEDHMLRLAGRKGRADQVSKIIAKAKELWRQHFKVTGVKEIQK